MTAAVIFDPEAGDNVEANLQIAEDALYVFGRSGKQIQRWQYDELANAFAAHEKMDRVLIRRGRPEIRLRLTESGAYDLVQQRSPQLRRRRRGFGISFGEIWQGVPGEGQIGLIIGVCSGVYFLYHWISGWFE
jgi:hypothetical protein